MQTVYSLDSKIYAVIVAEIARRWTVAVSDGRGNIALGFTSDLIWLVKEEA